MSNRAQVWKPIAFTLVGLIVASGLGGCANGPAKPLRAEIRLLQSGGDEKSASPTVLQSAVMRYADEYSMLIAQAAEDFAANVATTEARNVAARIKLGQASAAVINAAGQNPVVNALDMVVLASVSRQVAEDYLVGQRFGDAANNLLHTSRKLETNAWTLIKPVLDAEKQQELRELIAQWRVKNPDQRFVGAVRFREFAESIGVSHQTGGFKPTSVFSLLFLDPMAGLDPALRAVEETRYLAERALYYGQRMPILLSWQAEYLALQLADQPAPKQMLTNVDQLTASIQVFAKTAEQLPRLVDQQREAAIQQVFAGIAVERTNILASLASEEKATRALLAEARSTLEAATQMAASANTAVQSLESFMRYVAPPKTNTAAETVSNTNSRPFNILDYGTAAGEIGAMARDVNALLTSVNQSLPQATQLGQQAGSNVESLMWRAFWLALVLIVVLLAGAVLAAVLYRNLVLKQSRVDRGAPSSPAS